MESERTGRRLADQELRREAARVFPKLANGAGYIKPIAFGVGENQLDCGVYTRRNQYRRPVLVVAGYIVKEFMRNDWLCETNGQFVLSDEGLLWLRRHCSGAEPFREQHQLRENVHREVHGVRRPVLVNEGESPLGWLRRRKDRNGSPMITAEQYQAGERLRAEYERARLMPRLTSNWESAAPSRRRRRTAPQGVAGLSDEALAARERMSRALVVVGPELAGVLIDVCCHLSGLSEVEKSRGWPRRSGKVILQIALTRLATHYGLLKEEAAGIREARIHHWGADDYRPTIDQWR